MATFQTKRSIQRILAVLILGCSVSVGRDLQRLHWYVRAWDPYPLNYTQRLVALEYWNTGIGDGMNCSGFISNAHSSRFRKSYEFYSNALGDLDLLREVTDRSQIDESLLLPGDVAAFHGPASSNPLQQEGVHVAAYLGGGVWIDSDSRRGDVRRYRLKDKPESDQWFAGHVRLYRWKASPKFSLTVAASTVGKDDRSAI